MEPGLKPGDTIFCRRARASVQRGTIVVFTHPSSGLTMVKRVIGLPGELVAIDFGDVVINGRTGLDLWAGASTFPEGEWKLGPAEFFVLSDNRSATIDDSRRFRGLGIQQLQSVFWRVRGNH